MIKHLSSSLIFISICVTIMLIVNLNLLATKVDNNTKTSIAWSPNGLYLVTGGVYEYPVVEVWDLISNHLMTTLEEHQSSILSIVWSPDSSSFVSTGVDGQINVWAVPSFTLSQQMMITRNENQPVTITSITWHPQENWLASAQSYGETTIWDVETGERISSFMRPNFHEITFVSWSPDGTLLASSSQDGTLYLWQSSTRSVIQIITNETPIYSLDWSPNGKNLVSGDSEGTIKIWDVTTGNIQQEFKAETAFFAPVLWSPSSQMIIGGGQNGLIYIWMFDDNTIQTMAVNQPILGLDFSPYGGQVAYTLLDPSLSVRGETDFKVFVPNATIQLLNAITTNCLAPEIGIASVSDQTRLPEFVTTIEALSDDQIPPGCKADLLAVAQAIQAIE
jgi:WD40 repeat protein